ncbi:DNA/RNA non-specific endonuclease [Leptospira neocaledonica]|nr:DNA/RNA non-specific endonuclease [Leptospira neocaledonica]
MLAYLILMVSLILFFNCIFDRTAIPELFRSESINSKIKNDGTNCPFGNPLATDPKRYGKIHIIHREGYTLGHSSKYRMAIWVCEEILSEELLGKATRRNHFKPEPLLSKGERAELSDYKNSGYDRGHLAAADNYRSDQRLNDESFYLSNVVPQDHSFNAGIWKKLEEQIRSWVKRYNRVIVITVPVYIDDKNQFPRFIEKNNDLTVPNHFFKILVRDENGSTLLLAFLAKHKKATNISLESFLTTVDLAEEHTQLNFLPNIPDVDESLEATVGVYWP